MDRDDVVRVAREWIGTPYRHQASLKGEGADCLGLLRGVYKELYGHEPEKPPAYQPGWYDLRKDDLLLRKAHQYLVRNDRTYCAQPADVLFFRMRPHVAAKHCAIVSYDNRIIHALSGRCVEEVTLSGIYSKRCVASFRFPGL